MHPYKVLSVLANCIGIFAICCGLANSQIVPSNNFNFNQQCLHGSQCNNNAGLYCIPTAPTGQLRCGCPTNGTTFDEYQGRCVGKVGFPCIYQGNQSFCPEKAHCSHQDPHHPDLYYYESRCFCDVNYFANKQGKCILAAKFGEACSSSNKKCDEVSGLKCDDDGVCRCEFGSHHQRYDVKKDKCISILGKNCTGFYSCGDNARCEGISISRARPVGIPSLGSSSKNSNRNANDIRNAREIKTSSGVDNVGKCTCEYGFTATSDGKCLAGYRQPCSEAQPCNPEDNLECLDGSCNCKSPLNQNYDHTLKKCVNLVGAKCDKKLGNTCVGNAFCVNGICKCKETFSRTPYRKCMLDYQMPCENGQCNMYNGLTCKPSSKKCSCVDDSLIYNAESQACVSQVGNPCGKINQAGDYGKESFYISCEPLAICKEDPGGDSTTKFCRLMKDFA